MTTAFQNRRERRAQLVWQCCIAAFAVHSLVWGLRLLPDDAFRAIMSAERLLFLQGPPLALAQRTWPFVLLYLVGIVSSVFVLRRAIFAPRWLGTLMFGLAFAVLWCVWGILASAPII
jgi:hypothetical protein